MSELNLPEATKKPCVECPWLRSSVAGYLGPHSAKEWVEAAHGEQPIACHMTITNEQWTDKGMRQCQGAAIFRANVSKLPRRPEVIVSKPDTVKVFSWDNEFLAHHETD